MAYLEQTSTGRIYPYREQLVGRKDIIVHEGDIREALGKPVEPPKSSPKPSNDGLFITIDGEKVEAQFVEKHALADYVEAHFNADVDRRKSQGAILEMLQAQIDERGHPDADEE